MDGRRPPSVSVPPTRSGFFRDRLKGHATKRLQKRQKPLKFARCRSNRPAVFSRPSLGATLSFFLRCFVASLLYVALAGRVHGQVVVSNLSATSAGTLSYTPTQAVAGAFTTGDTPMTLVDVTLSLGNASGPDSVFTVALYSSTGGLPGTLLETLSGPAGPQSAGNYSYTSGGSILSANTTYFWTGTLTSSASGDRRRQNITSSFAETSSFGWTIANSGYVKIGAGDWFSDSSVPMFTVSAAAIPEPDAFAVVAGLVGLGLATRRRRRQPVTPKLAR